jgi:serine/threonine protein kinase
MANAANATNSTTSSINDDGVSGVRRGLEDGPRSLAHIRPGTVIDGKYLVERVLGQGGMGVVIAAMHLEENKRVALKFLEVQGDEMPDDFHARFALEARVCAKLRNPHIARVHGMGVWQGTFPFMVMDYLEGEDLRTLRKRGSRLPLGQAVGYVIQICEGLAEAHAQGIVHRDLKPGNIFITKEHDGSELVKVLDFGISKWAAGGEESNELTKAGTMLGSPKYMSPEQLTGTKVDPRADIWSIGAILYAMLTGKPPYNFSQMTQMFMAIASGKIPAAPSTVDPTIPATVDAVVLRCLARERDDRFKDVGELAAALLAAVGSPYAAPVSGQIRLMLDPANVANVNGSIPPAFATRASGTQTIFSIAGIKPPRTSARPPMPTIPPASRTPRQVQASGSLSVWWGLVWVLAALAIAAVRVLGDSPATNLAPPGAVQAASPANTSNATPAIPASEP